MTKDAAYRSARGFRVECHAQADCTVVDCHGKLTAENAPLLKNEVREMIPNHKRIILDLKEVPLMDSSGLGTIVNAGNTFGKITGASGMRTMDAVIRLNF